MRIRIPCLSMLCTGLLYAATATASGGCAAPYSGSGQATDYSQTDGAAGACGLPYRDGATLAIDASRWIGSAHCGEWLKVTGPNGSAVLEVTDECASCNGGLDLTPSTFSAIASSASGIAQVRWERVDDPGNDNPAVTELAGSSAYYIALSIDHTRQGVTAVAIRSVSGLGGWQALTRSMQNQFTLLPATMLNYPLSVQLTSASGEILELDGLIATDAASNDLTFVGASQFAACNDRIFANDMGSDL